jgi:hypothetical protein
LSKAAIAWFVERWIRKENFLAKAASLGFLQLRIKGARAQERAEYLPGSAGFHNPPLCCPTRPDFNFIQIFAACSSSFYSIIFHGFCTTQLLLTVLPAGVCPLHVKMESLSDTLWDVVISGTGLQQSLLAL